MKSTRCLANPAKWRNSAPAALKNRPLKRLFTGLLIVAGMLPVAAMASPLDQAIKDGKHLFMTPGFGGNGRSCDTCHKGGGTTMGQLPNGKPIPSLNNAATIFPRYNPGRGTVLTLQDQVHNCVMGAIQGTPPPYGSKEMVDLVSYLTSLSQGKAIDMGGKPE
jgi:thiosulfate dehydrogenase